jgi:NAD-dependent SIR2 family protein deacetylase
MKADDFRRIALGMKGAIESAHMGHPDFRANDKIFATIHHDQKSGMVKLTPEQQAKFVRENPSIFGPRTGHGAEQARQRCTWTRRMKMS